MRNLTLRIGSALLVCSWVFGCGSSESAEDGDASPGSRDGMVADQTGDSRLGDPRDRSIEAPIDAEGESDGTGDVVAEGSRADVVNESTANDAGKDSGGFETSTDASAEGSAPRDAGAPGDGGVCGALSTGPMPSGGDTTYAWSTSTPPACLSGAFCQVDCDGALLAGLLGCEAVQGGFFWGQGSVYVRVVGRQSGACVFDIGLETEGSVTVQRCTTPLPVQPWRGLYNVNQLGSSSAPNLLDGLDGCVRTAPCSLLQGSPNPCDRGPSGPPLCPSAGVRGPC